jgi:hypothetical protein
LRNSFVYLMIAGATMLAEVTLAQQTPPDSATTATGAATTPAAPTPPATKSPLTQWGTDFSFLLDGYVDANFNHPDSTFNQLHNFDYRANNAHINMGKITIDHAPAPVGFHLDVGFGQTFDMIHSTDRAPEAFKYFEQAYVSFKPKAFHGVQVDAGEFVTSAGAEVIETNANFNYTRSLLFALAIPYYHFGFRTTIPIGPHFTGGFQVVQGWNNIYDNNSGKTFGFTGAYAWKKVTWSNVYYVGPEKTGTTKGLRNLYDTTVAVNQNDHLSYYVNFDYGRDKNISSGAAQWTGLAGAARYGFKKNYAIAGRLEFLDDVDGFATGTNQVVKEFTITGEYKPTSWLLTRLEFRHDWSDQPYFQEHDRFRTYQPELLFGMVIYLAPKK